MSLSTAVAAPPATSTASRPARIDAVDVVRGLVIVLMLLDHTRDFAHRDAAVFQPTDLSRTTVALFLTRWVTHFCAPVFVLLAGTGIGLQRLRGTSRRELSRYLLTRGLWLIVLEFTVVRFGLAFDLDYRAFPGLLEVTWVLGVSMVLLAAVLAWPPAWLAAAGGALVGLHNLADGITVPGWTGPGSPGPSPLGAFWMVLHQPGFLVMNGVPMLVAYPLLPWLGVMLLGCALAASYGWTAERRQRLFVRCGLALVGLFVVLRATNGYGDPASWSVQSSGAFTLLSFLNATKYPPSLLFLSMTLGPALLLLTWVERHPLGWIGRRLTTWGRVPLFFFLLQWFVAHPLVIGVSLLAGKPIAHLFGMPAATPPAPGGGFGLAATYLFWVAGLAITYPLCRWYGELKRRRPDAWLRYL